MFSTFLPDKHPKISRAFRGFQHFALFSRIVSRETYKLLQLSTPISSPFYATHNTQRTPKPSVIQEISDKKVSKGKQTTPKSANVHANNKKFAQK